MSKSDQFLQVWSLEAPQERVTARLTSVPGDSPKLSVVSWGSEKPSFLRNPELPILHGDGREPITFVENRNFAAAAFFGFIPDVAEIEPRTIFFGIHLPSPNPSVVSVEFSTKGLNAWFTERSVTLQVDESEEDHYIVRKPEPKIVQMRDGLVLEIELGVSISSSFLNEDELSVRRKPWFRLRYPSPTSLEEAMTATRKLVGFLEFLADGSLEFDQVFIYPDTQEESYEMIAQWIKGGHPPRGGHNLVWFEAVRNNWQPHINAWWEMYDRIPFALDSYRACHRRPGQTLELRYLAIVGALEAFHRSIVHPGKMPLRERLEDLSDRYSDVLFNLMPRADAKRIVHTRDHIAHQTVFRNTSLIPVEHRWAWFRRLVTAFELCLVSHLGFSEEQIKGISRNRQAAIEQGFLGDWDFTV